MFGRWVPVRLSHAQDKIDNVSLGMMSGRCEVDVEKLFDRRAHTLRSLILAPDVSIKNSK